MADSRPDLDAIFSAFDDDEEALVTLPGELPVKTQVVRQAAFNPGFPADTGNDSLTKGRPVFSLRLDDLGVADVPYGTTIEVAGESWFVEATDKRDDQVAHVIARKGGL